MNTKPIFRSSAMLLFFMLLFSKPYIARCQTATTDNAPVNKEVRIEIDSMVDADGNVNAKRTIFIDGKQMPADFEWVEADVPDGAQVEKEVIIVKGGDGSLPADIKWIEDSDVAGSNKKVIIITDDADMPADYDFIDLDESVSTNGKVIVIKKEVETTKKGKTKKQRRNKHDNQQEIEVIEIIE